jgi:hypothetical protein
VSEGWTPETTIETALPALRGSMVSVDTSPDVFRWDPI